MSRSGNWFCVGWEKWLWSNSLKVMMLALCCSFISEAQAQTRDRSGWFDYGSNHISKWLMIAPAKLGPNALPVPRMDYGRVADKTSLELAGHAHFMKGDKAVNSYFNFSIPVVPSKVMVEVWGFPSETFKMSNEVRDERQIYADDTGWITHEGDIWISTSFQLLKDRTRLPDVLVSYSVSLTTGSNQHGRYTDAPITYFFVSAGKSYAIDLWGFERIRPAIMAGYYIWQTNKVEMAQDEGPLGGLGLELRASKFSIYQELCGYSGYDAYAFMGKTGYNDPLVYRSRFSFRLKSCTVKLEYQKGLHDYHYDTFRLGVVFPLWDIKRNVQNSNVKVVEN